MNSKIFWCSVFFLEFLEGLFWGGQILIDPATGLLIRLALLLAIVFWLHTDMRLHNYRPAFDSRTFLFVAWPIVGPYYLFRTRGWKAFIPIAGFIALIIVAMATGYMVGAMSTT